MSFPIAVLFFVVEGGTCFLVWLLYHWMKESRTSHRALRRRRL